MEAGEVEIPTCGNPDLGTISGKAEFGEGTEQ